MKRVFKNLSATLAGLMLATTVFPLVAFNTVRAADYYEPIEITEENFPDINLLSVLKDIDKNHPFSNKNGKIEYDEVAFWAIDCSNKYIKSLEGLDKLPELRSLYCDGNSIKTIDLSANHQLWDLTCSNNGLTSLKFDPTNIRTLACRSNKLKSLDVSGCTYLETLDCFDNHISELSLNNCTKLDYLNCSFNELEKLDVSKNVILDELYCTNNYLTSLDLSKCTKLKTLDCWNNEITSLNLSKNTLIKEVHCENNKLTNLNVSGLSNLKYLYCNDNKLTSVNPSDSKDLNALCCSNNQISSLDISPFRFLYRIECSNNKLTSLDTSNNPGLGVIKCAGNSLTSFATYTDISTLDVSNNKLTSLDMEVEIRHIYCNDNQLTSLSIPGESLESLICHNNKLTSIDLSQQKWLRELSTFGNNISSISLSSSSLDDKSDFAISSAITSLIINSSSNYYCVSDDAMAYADAMGYHTYEYSDKFYSITLPDGKVVYYYRTLLAVDSKTKVTGANYMPTPTPTATATATPKPTAAPTATPTSTPSKTPTSTPTSAPTSTPTNKPDVTAAPTKTPATVAPTKAPGATVTPVPTAKPGSTTVVPTKAPGATATPVPTAKPGSGTVTPTKVPGATATPVPTKAPGATSTPKPTTAPGAKPTSAPSKPSNPSAPSASSDNGVGGFIDRLYTVALGRDFDEGGKNYWTNEIKFNGKNGADIAYQFLYSDEFLGKNMSQDDFLTVLYRTFFDREPDAGGLKFWKDQMSAGQTKEWVIAGFINSEEWANICLSFGIRSGSSVAPTITIAPNENVIGFATRLYTTCLNREYDPSGLDFWAKELANLRRTGSEAAKGFFFSDEIAKSGISDSEFLTRLYKTLMNREPEKEGFDYWLGQMKSGAMSRSDVFDGFAASEEWVGICADYGILR